MLFIHEMVAQAGSTTGDAAIREEDIECTQCRGDAVHEQTVAEADGGVSSVGQGSSIDRCRPARVPECRSTAEEGDESQDRDCHGEDDDVAHEGHGESRSRCMGMAG